MQYIVDRMEEDYVVCEDEKKQMHDLLKKDLPSGVKPGDVLLEKDGVFQIDKEETEKRTKEISELMDDLWD